MNKEKQLRKNSKRIEYIVRVGPELMKILDKQVQIIKDVTYGVVKDSYWEAGEIVAKKFNGEV